MFHFVWQAWDRVGLHDWRLGAGWWTLAISAVFIAVNAALFVLTNQMWDARGTGGVWDPSTLFMLGEQSLDRRIPFLPWTLTVYATLLLFLFVPWLAHSRDESGARDFKLLIQSLIWLNLFAHVFFFSLPTAVEMRDQVHSGLKHAPQWRGFYQHLYALVTPFNAWPCLHVAQPLLIVLAVSRWTRHRGAIVGLSLWFGLLCASVLTTKQHYLWDVLTGIILALFVYGFIFRRGMMLERKRSQEMGPDPADRQAAKK